MEPCLDELLKYDHIRVLVLANTSDPGLLVQFEGRPHLACLYKPPPMAALRHALSDLLEETYAEPRRTDDEHSHDASYPDFRGRRILVVDDNEVNRKLLVMVLRNTGAEVYEAATGSQAIELAAAQRFDLIMMDLHMPKISGFDASEKIRSAEPTDRQTPIIALSANTLPQMREKVISSGLNDFIGKPVVLEDLWSLMYKWLEDPLVVNRKPSAAVQAASKQRAALSGHLPVYDEQLANRLATGNRPLARQMLDKFGQELPGQLARIHDNFQKGDLLAVYEEVHRVNGSAIYCGTPALRAAAEVLEQALDQEDHDTIAMKLEVFQNKAKVVLQYLAAELTTQRDRTA